MIGWGQILLGAVLTTALGAVVLGLILRERNPRVLAPLLAATFLGPIAWNSILHRAGGDGFFVDIAFKPFPISWQDTGSGVFTLAAASATAGMALTAEPAGRVLRLAAIAAAVALLVDVYLY